MNTRPDHKPAPFKTAFVGAQVHDGRHLFENHALVIDTAGRTAVMAKADLPAGLTLKTLSGGVICPGFVDLQVNGGGGVMFNDDQSVDTLRNIARAHRGLGTAAILPTLITDTPDRTCAAIDAVDAALKDGEHGIIGIHLEGPHLSIARKGAHDPTLMRTMTQTDLAVLLSAAERLPNVMVTVAPETTTNAQIKTMANAGILVSLGHTDASFETCMAAFDAGARCATHLFNAMSPLGSRDPGLVGAVLARDDVHAGLIADGLHVHPTTIQIALAATRAPGRIFLVTDSMATAGSSIDHFTLNGRKIYRKDGRLTLKDGTLAGAHLDMATAISVISQQAGDTLAGAIARATSLPASLLRHGDGIGTLNAGLENIVHIKPDQTVSFLT